MNTSPRCLLIFFALPAVALATPKKETSPKSPACADLNAQVGALGADIAKLREALDQKKSEIDESHKRHHEETEAKAAETEALAEQLAASQDHLASAKRKVAEVRGIRERLLASLSNERLKTAEAHALGEKLIAAEDHLTSAKRESESKSKRLVQLERNLADARKASEAERHAARLAMAKALKEFESAQAEAAEDLAALKRNLGDARKAAEAERHAARLAKEKAAKRFETRRAETLAAADEKSKADAATIAGLRGDIADLKKNSQEAHAALVQLRKTVAQINDTISGTRFGRAGRSKKDGEKK